MGQHVGAIGDASARSTCCSTSSTPQPSRRRSGAGPGSRRSTTIGARPRLISSTISSRGRRDAHDRARASAARLPTAVRPGGRAAARAPGTARAPRPRRRGRARRPSRRFSRTVRPKNSDRSSGTWRQPRRATSWGRRADGGPPEDVDLAAEDGQEARDGEQRGGLARAVRAEQRHDLARVDVEVEVAHDGDAVVAGVQPGRRRARRTARSPPCVAEIGAITRVVGPDLGRACRRR